MGRSESSAYPETSWQALQYFNLYRFLVAFLFVSLVWIGSVPQPLGMTSIRLFSLAAHIYLASSIAIAFTTRFRTIPYNLHVTAHVLVDVAAITLLMFASAGLSSGFGMLMVIAVAGGSILCAGRIAILFAAIATLFVLGHELYVQLAKYYPPANYTHAGLLGITFFATAILGHALSARVRRSEALVKQREADVESLARLNDHIVQHMQSGIIVLDDACNIRLINQSACALLGLERKIYNKPVAAVSPELAGKIDQWLHHGGMRSVIVSPARSEIEIQASFTRLQPETRLGILVFLEDVAMLRQKAQQMKLASLGRLAASIAHEVRNPLGAISHAGQLLSESGSVNGEDSRLIEIIMQHSYRVNSIIENMQQISRREQPTPENINIKSWLGNFIEEFSRSRNIENGRISSIVEPHDLIVCMDPSQLHQVLWNLSENAIRYSDSHPSLEFRCGLRAETERPYLDIIDHGPGIPEDVKDHVFEPFFKVNSTGSGLGLYIARELCEANQATLSLHSSTRNGCCFRINFPPPDAPCNLVQ